MQIDDDKESSKTDCSDTSYNSSTASECQSQDEFVQKSRSFTCSDVEYKCVQAKRKPRRLTRRKRNEKWAKKLLRKFQDLSSDQNNGKTENVSGKDIELTVKEKPITDGETVNTDQQSVHDNAETVTPDKDNVHADEDNVNPNEVRVIVPVKIKQEDKKPNVQDCAVHGNSAVSNQSGELFLDVAIKKEDSEDDPELNDSSMSVKGKLSDEVSGRSFAELVTAANNGKQEDVDVDVSLYTDSAQTLQVDDNNTQYSGTKFLNSLNKQFVLIHWMSGM